LFLHLFFLFFLLLVFVDSPHLHSFPTRRSSDLPLLPRSGGHSGRSVLAVRRLDGVPLLPGQRRTFLALHHPGLRWLCPGLCAARDRKSTRLNSSHVKISYAVFCLKKKKYDQ